MDGDTDFSEQLPTAENLFRELSDLLVSCSYRLARTGGANWDRAEELFRLARGAARLHDDVVGLLSNEYEPREETNLPGNARVSPKTSVKNQRPTETGKLVRKKDGYPKYCVRGDLLIKTGLSRDGRKQYEHSVPKKEFDSIISILAEFSASRKEFTVEEVQARLDCPGYQIYTVLALLKARGILRVPRRGLYGFATKGLARATVDLWRLLEAPESTGPVDPR
jgi:hypothetical protein